ncbi:hypothetical protein [Bacillus sp. REN3]|uniref:hypothetical protein n=1 Tax=Bacillus sp. REN3 TaxID=2802440 RepID=UPI001AEE8A3C|nr:hypothetical protein [Bacillus sp. REN3]
MAADQPVPFSADNKRKDPYGDTAETRRSGLHCPRTAAKELGTSIEPPKQSSRGWVL